MVSILKVIGVMSCSFVLFLSLSNVTPAGERQHRETQEDIHTIKGEVLRVDGEDFLVRAYGGKEVSLRVESATETDGPIGRGDQIEAKVREVNDKITVLSLRQVKQ